MSAVAFFQRLEKCPRQSSNVWNSSRNAVSSRRLWRRDSLIPAPAMFQVPFSPGSAHSTRRKPSLQTRSPKPPGNSPRVCSYGANVAAICLFGGKRLPVALLVLAPGTAPASASRAVAGVAPSALRGLVLQSPNTIYQSDPICPSLRQQRPSEAKRACFSVPGQNTGRPLCYEGKRARLPLANARCLWPSTERALRLFRGGAGFALQRPPTGPLRAGRPPRRCPARWQPGTAPAKLSRCLLA